MTWLKTIFAFVFPSWAVYLLAGTLILGAIGAIYATLERLEALERSQRYEARPSAAERVHSI